MNILITTNTPADIQIVIGIVINQAQTIVFAVDHLTHLIRSAAPTPIIEDAITWVVLTGRCR